ncbi:VCBS repeat-containing protein [Sinomicrobium pectinilyticum]|uniref:VCBS repeat-containing protein n=1 Tax=Sinomicrobium pectinilyticum TaxID=1084421 RepID=A0A3N0EJP3_SINP1|nr:VCBS repeat-containing protein [Sinomicrobium pectinilyticum]RNL87879.1 VCBS repeat-containing protein [Sinomicrobium pectinilyticum]
MGTRSNRTASITLSDIDRDGDLDALVANGRDWTEQNYVFYNDGKGGFKQAQPIGKFLNASYAMVSADFNNDGFMDIAVANVKPENSPKSD